MPVLDLESDETPSERKTLREALFVSNLEVCEHVGDADVRAAIVEVLRAWGAPQCAGQVAQEFGDHPERAVTRMRWAILAVAAAYRDMSPAQALASAEQAIGNRTYPKRGPKATASTSPATPAR